MSEVTVKEITKEGLFNNGRENLVIEVGHGGPGTLLKDVRDYLRDSDSNYLGVDPDPEANSGVFEKFGGKNFVEDVTDLPGSLDGQASEVWMRNFKGMGKDTSNAMEDVIFNKVFKLLSPGGKLLFVNSYDNYKAEQVRQVLESMRGQGFEARVVDPDTVEHPFVKNFKTDLPTEVVIVASKQK